MTPFLNGFADELMKLAAYPQSHVDAPPYDAGVAGELDKAQGARARDGLKAPTTMPPPTQRRPAPTPLTTPNHMVDYTNRSG